MNSPHDAPIDQALAYRLHRTNRMLLTHLGRFLDAHHSDLGPEQFFIVMKLHEAGPLAQNALVEVALDDGPNVSRLVERLVRAGLVERAEDPTDRRARVLELTQDGHALADRLRDDVAEERRIVFEGISDRALATLASVLDRVDANLRTALADARRD